MGSLATWESHIHDRHNSGATPYVEGEGYWLAGSEHYDVIQCMLAARDYCAPAAADIPPYDWSVEIAAAEVRYRDRCVIEGGSIPEYEIFTRGLARRWLETADERNRTAIDIIRPATGDPEVYARNYWNGLNLRPVALLLMACLDRDVCEMTACPLRDAAARTSLEHIAQVVQPDGSYYGFYVKPFMLGLCLRSLIAYHAAHEEDEDATRAQIVAEIPAAVEAACDWLWETCWLPEDAAINYITHAWDDPIHDPIAGLTIQSSADTTHFVGPGSLSSADDFYRTGYLLIDDVWHGIAGYDGATRTFEIWPANGALTPGTEFSVNAFGTDEGDAPTPAAELNQMIAPAFAWAYRHRKVTLGDAAGAARHRDRHDAMFNGGTMANEAVFQQKQWNQSLLWTTDGLAYRDAADAFTGEGEGEGDADGVLVIGPVAAGGYLFYSRSTT